ncbi:hypothetical protein BKA69DRAFT_1043156 [Paraphysoderma sedebokerense]|nr:hypothetical protein BKA69DRAFT_1043156 [Paraphysoderma sedebokerense]
MESLMTLCENIDVDIDHSLSQRLVLTFEIKLCLPGATGRLRIIWFHEPTETFHFPTQWQGPYPNFGQGSDVDGDMEDVPSTTSTSTFNMDDSDMVERLEDECDQPGHLECGISDSTIAISESAGPPPPIAHKSTSIPSHLTAEADRSTPQFRGSIDKNASMENQSPIDRIYHRYILRDQFESYSCYTQYNVIVMWDHHVDRNETFRLNKSAIRVVSYG